MERSRGKWETLAIQRHQRDLALAAQPGGHPRGFRYDPEAAEKPVRWIERFCKHHKGEWAGQPLILSEDQKAHIIRPLFGWLRADGTRRYRKAWIEVPRKYGKTEVAAAIGIYLLVGDGEPGGEVYCTATKEKQAKIVWDAMAAMVKASPALKKYVEIFRSQGGTLACERLGAKAQPLGSDSETLDGLNPHGDIRDEVHEWKDHGLAAVLDTAAGARRQPLTVEITTAGVYDPKSVGWQHHEYATQILEGAFEDDRMFVFIVSLDDGDDPFDPATWAKANPNLGVTPKLDYIREQAEEARRNTTKLNDFLRYHCNRWTQQITRWLSVERWQECDAARDRAEFEKALEGRTCYAGLDLSTKLDLTALVLAFPLDDGAMALLLRAWLPEERVEEQAKKGRRHYEQWVREGWITATPGNVIDYGWIRRELNSLGEKYRIAEVGFDNWNSSQIATDLGETDGFAMVEMRQGFQTLSEPSKAFEALVVGRQIRHGGNPVLRWAVGNAVIKKDPAGNIKPDKEKASDKIDPVVAAIMAIGRANLGGSGGGSYLESSEMVTLD